MNDRNFLYTKREESDEIENVVDSVAGELPDGPIIMNAIRPAINAFHKLFLNIVLHSCHTLF